MKSQSLATLDNDTLDIQRNVQKCFNTYFQQISSIDEQTRKNMWIMFHNYMSSLFACKYASKLNTLIKTGNIASNELSRKDFSKWFNSEVIEAIDHLSENEIYDETKVIVSLSEIINNLIMSINCVDDDDIEKEADYVLDTPYRIREILEACSDIPKMHIQEIINKPTNIRVLKSQYKFKITGNFSPSVKMTLKAVPNER